MRLTPQQLEARKKRNVAIALALAAFAVLIFITTALSLKRNIEMSKAMRAVAEQPR
ncbi:MAG TPA: hypothetical protein VGE54_04030 [Brevundimonas sp.]